jgi:xanthine dehydrogenase accessory factor
MDRRMLTEALRLLDARRPFVRAVVVRSVGSVPGKVGASMLIREDGTFLGTVGGAALEEKVKELAAEALERQRGDLYHFDLQKWREGGLPSLCGGSVDIAVEYVAAPPHLLLWGGGHVAHALAQLLPGLGYDYSVADDRAAWIGPDRFPAAVTRTRTDPESLWQTLNPRDYSHLYVLGYDARKDGEVLRRSVPVFPGYIGLIASETKREHLFADLRHSGIDEPALARIHSPIGLSIGAETPPEIAVSVVAEIVRDRRMAAAAARPRTSASSLAEHHGVGTA